MANDLAALIDEVQALLVDANVTFTDATVTAALTQALREINLVDRYDRIGTITLASDTREIDLATLTQPCQVDRVWLPYDAADPEDPPNWRTFEQWTLTLLYISDGDEPDSTDVARIFYHTPHTIDDLASATATTLDDAQVGALVYGGAANALSARAVDISESVNANKSAVESLKVLRDRYRAVFDDYLKSRRRGSAGSLIPWSSIRVRARLATRRVR